MSRDEFCAASRRNWDERVTIHRRDTTEFSVERFLAGEKRLHAIDSGELGSTEPPGTDGSQTLSAFWDTERVARLGVPLEVADERRQPHRAAVALARVLDGGFGFALIRIARPSG